MSEYWKQQFRHRMSDFADRRPPRDGEVPVSIKIRVTSGCFHREHSPHAYDLIDQHLSSLSADETDFMFEEHESGPEILVFLAVTTASITLAKSIIDLVTAIVKARSQGIRQGDHPCDPLKLIIRRSHSDGECQEEEVMEIESHDDMIEIEIEEPLEAAVTRLLQDELSENE